jgi:hypothetical protein
VRQALSPIAVRGLTAGSTSALTIGANDPAPFTAL